MRISIITPSYNQAQFIGRTIDSIISQEGDFELDYRVLDGGSSDGTVEILKSYGARIQWTSERDGGQVDAINKGLRSADGDIVAWVNSDDVLMPGALAAVAAAFRTHPQALWLHGRCEIIDVHDRPIRGWISRYKHRRAMRHSFAALLKENYVSQMTAFWRRGVHDRVGYIDDSIKLAFDYDFWLRLAQLGEPVYLAQTLACFRWYPTSKSGANYQKQFDEDYRVAAKYAPPGSDGVMRIKRLKSRAIVAIYKTFGLFRKLGQRAG